jgi:hypothetical protein
MSRTSVTKRTGKRKQQRSGIVRDERGQDQPRTKDDAQRTSLTPKTETAASINTRRDQS